VKTNFETFLLEKEKEVLNLPWDNQLFYSNFLAQTYCYVRNSLRILTFAAAYTKIDKEMQRNQLLRHVQEEQGHDRLLVTDLKQLGVDASSLKEFYSTTSFYEMQLFKIQNYGAESVFGWALVLEGIAALYGPDIYERCQSKFGDQASRFLKVHANEDPEHFQNAIQAAMKASDSELKTISNNFYHSYYLYLNMLDDCQKTSGVLYQTSAA